MLFLHNYFYSAESLYTFDSANIVKNLFSVVATGTSFSPINLGSIGGFYSFFLFMDYIIYEEASI